jgi:hypothetical protein
MQTVAKRTQFHAIFAVLLCLPLWLGAAPLEVGAVWPTLLLKDQNDQTVIINEATRQVIFAAEKSVSDWVNRVLGEQGMGTLAQSKTVYVADISAMPAVISRMFAIPKLRELPFSIALAREAVAVADLPRRKGAATLLTLEGGRLIQVRHLEAAAQLRQALALTP